MNKDVPERLSGAITRLKEVASALVEAQCEDTGAELAQIASDLNDMWLDLVLTVEAVEPIFSARTGVGRNGELSVMDLCYNAFMIGRRGIPREPEADRCDWMNDTLPLMTAGVERMHKESLRRMEYARGDRYVQDRIERERQAER